MGTGSSKNKDHKTVCVSYLVSGNKTGSTPNPNPQSGSTVLSRASAYGHSQFKLQNLGVGGYREKVLKWFNYPRARAQPRCEVGSHGGESTCIIGLSVLRRGQPDSGEGCIMLQSGLTRSLVAKVLQQCANFVLQGRNTANQATDRCVQT